MEPARTEPRASRRRATRWLAALAAAVVVITLWATPAGAFERDDFEVPVDAQNNADLAVEKAADCSAQHGDPGVNKIWVVAWSDTPECAKAVDGEALYTYTSTTSCSGIGDECTTFTEAGFCINPSDPHGPPIAQEGNGGCPKVFCPGGDQYRVRFQRADEQYPGKPVMRAGPRGAFKYVRDGCSPSVGQPGSGGCPGTPPVNMPSGTTPVPCAPVVRVSCHADVWSGEWVVTASWRARMPQRPEQADPGFHVWRENSFGRWVEPVWFDRYVNWVQARYERTIQYRSAGGVTRTLRYTGERSSTTLTFDADDPDAPAPYTAIAIRRSLQPSARRTHHRLAGQTPRPRASPEARPTARRPAPGQSERTAAHNPG